MHCYVWYRVRHDDAETETAVRAMMARLACRGRVAGQLLRRHDEPRLWLEAYQDIGAPEPFLHLMTALVAQYDLDMFTDGARRVELFQADARVPAC